MADRLGEAWMNDCRIHSTIIKRGLVSVNPPLINAPLKRGTVSAMTTAKQQTMAERIRLVMGADNAYDVVRKLERAGTAVSEQTIYNWLDGSEIKESNLAAFAQLYGTTPAWLRYGIGERESLSEKGAEGGRLVQQLPDELLQETLDFLGYKLQRPDVQVAEETRASYFKFSEKVRQDMARRKGGR